MYLVSAQGYTTAKVHFLKIRKTGELKYNEYLLMN